MFKALENSVGLKLCVWVIVTLGVILTATTMINISYQNNLSVQRERQSQERLVDAILTALRYPMMTGDQEVIQLQFDRYKELKGIEIVSLDNHKGIIKRSSDTSLINQKSTSKHIDAALEGKEYVGVEKNDGTGKTVSSDLRPILNETRCNTCHGSTEKVLGVLRVDSDWTPVTKALAQTRNINILVSLLGLAIMSILVSLLLRNMLTKPVNYLIKGTAPLADGDITSRIEINSKDELGRLSNAYNKIVDSMHSMVSQVRNHADKVANSSEEMSASTQEMNSSTQEISKAIVQVSKGTLTQAKRVEETFEIMKKASVSLKQVVANAQTASQAVDLTSSHAEGGRLVASETVNKIERLSNTVQEATKVIQDLGQMSQQIGEITETITSIADQTNLLALNAAIEAARAGEAGRGFAVVAEEVRKLAEGSAEAVRKIGGLIKSTQSETNRAVNAIQTSYKEVQEGKVQVNKITEILSDINKAAREASGLAQQIAITGQERVEETERVVSAINEIATIAKESASTTQEVTSSTQEQTASMQEMAASAQELARLAMDLKNLVGKFKLKEETSGRKVIDDYARR